MKVSGFTIVRNACKYGYPVLESIQSILPICDEMIVNIGDSEDKTKVLIESLKDPKIRIIENRWDMSMGKEVLSYQTNLALNACSGDWAFYLQSDEIVHEVDLPRIVKSMHSHLHKDIDVLRFKWLHFYGSFYRYRIDRGWYQKQDRIVRNNGQVQSMGDAWAFERKDQGPLKRALAGAFIYHYGWVQAGDIMSQRRENAETIGFIERAANEKEASYDYGDLGRFPIYFGSHPQTMKEIIAHHQLSQEDWKNIKRKNWWNPMLYVKPRIKTPWRIKQSL